MAGRVNDKVIEINGSSLVKKSNALALSKITYGLSTNEMQLLAYSIHSTNKENVSVFLKKDFEKTFNMESYSTPRAIKDSDKLMDMKISAQDLGEDEFIKINVLQMFHYKKGVFTAKWAEMVLDHILDMKERYIITDMTMVTKFKSSFSWLLYEHLKAKYGAWSTVLTKEDIIDMLGVKKTSSYMKNTGTLKKKILDIAIEDLNQYSELKVSYEDIKEGRSIVGFKFIWSTGTLVTQATNKQIETLKSLVTEIFNDTLMYVDIKDDKDRDRALSIIRELKSIKTNYLDGKEGITTEFYNECYTKIQNYVIVLNRLVTPKDDTEIEVPMFDWLNN